MRIVTNLLSTLFIIFITLFLLELALHGFYYFKAKQPLFTRFAIPIYTNDEYRMHAVKPHLSFKHQTGEFDILIYTNSQGFRVSGKREEYSIKKDPQTFRIMLLGPSFAFGWAVNYEDSFSARLERILRDEKYAGKRDVQIINAGVPSLSPFRQLNWYTRKGLEYRPDLVIQMIYGNMVVSNRDTSKNNVSKNGYLLNDRKLTFVEYIRMTLLRYSATVHYSWTAYCRIKESFFNSQSAGREIIGAGRDLENYTDFDLRDRKVMEAINYYEDLRMSVEASGARLLILYFPLSYVVHVKDIPRWEIYGVRDITKQIDFNRIFCEYLNKRGFNCLNISAKLIQESNESEDRLYYYLDLHWTPKGNFIAAQETANHLLKESSESE